MAPARPSSPQPATSPASSESAPTPTPPTPTSHPPPGRGSPRTPTSIPELAATQPATRSTSVSASTPSTLTPTARPPNSAGPPRPEAPDLAVIVIDGGDTVRPDAAPTPGRASLRLQAKKVAQASRVARRKVKRVGRITGAELVEARKKKRKMVAPAPPTEEVSHTTPGVQPRPPVESLQDADFAALAAQSALSADHAARLPCDEAIDSTNVDDRVEQRDANHFAGRHALSSRPLQRNVAPPPALFNLGEFAQSFTPVTSVAASPPAGLEALAEKVDQLFTLFDVLRRELRPDSHTVGVATPNLPMTSIASPTPAGQAAVSGAVRSDLTGPGPLAPHTSWTLALPGSHGDLPPAAIYQLRCSSFEVPRSRVKGEYHPPQAHQLAAHRMFHLLTSESGRWLTPMSFVLYIRELECVRFEASEPAILQAIYSARLGARGLIAMHFSPQSEMETLQRGSTNANFSADFGASAALPTATATCASYEDLLAAIGGLISFGDAMWFDHVRRLLSRLKRFVLTNMERDCNTPERVNLTLLYVNQFLGKALAHLQVDSPYWWRDFNEAVRAVDYHGADWQAALNGLALRLAAPQPPARATLPARPSATSRQPFQPRRGPASRTPVMPDPIRRLIPRDAAGREPCSASWLAACATAGAWSAVRTTSEAGTTDSRATSKISSTVRTALTGATPVAATRTEDAEELPVRRPFGFLALPTQIRPSTANRVLRTTVPGPSTALPDCYHIEKPVTAPLGPTPSPKPPLGASRIPESPHGTASTTESPHGTSRVIESLQGTSNLGESPRGLAVLDPRGPHRPPRSDTAGTLATLRSHSSQKAANKVVPRSATLLPSRSAVCGCSTHHQLPQRRRFIPGSLLDNKFTSDAADRASLWERIRLRNINSALGSAGLSLPPASPKSVDGFPSLNKALQSALSEFVRRTRIGLPDFVELMRGQTREDYRPNKRMLPEVIRRECAGYQHLDALLRIARSGARAPLLHKLPRQRSYPSNHKSADDRYPVLIKNIRKEQDQWRYLVLDLDILDIWPEVHISPFGVVNKGDSDPITTGRVIHDLSFPEGESINDATDADSLCPTELCPTEFIHCDAIAAEILCPTEFIHCGAIAAEILVQRQRHPDAEVVLQAGDVASAFRNVCTHSSCAHLFGGRLPRDNALVIDTSAAFGWSDSPASYGIVGGTIAYVHGNSRNHYRAPGPFNNYWVDDHINVAADIDTNCQEVEQSLRHAMITVLGHGAINDEKFTQWNCRQRILGLVFDTVAMTVAIPESKVRKARDCVLAAYTATSLSRSVYRSLLGKLRHVATCVRPARPFLQRLRRHECRLRRWQHVPLSDDMKQDLLWWLVILDSPLLNGVSIDYFHRLPPPDVVVAMDASDSGICTLIPSDRTYLRYEFNEIERSLIAATKVDPAVGFDINFRELLSCAFAVQAWGAQWCAHRRSARPIHVQFRIDNTSAVSWQNKLSSPNPRAQAIIRLLTHWEVELGVRFSASHVPGAENRIADAGLRVYNSLTMTHLFNELTLGWMQVKPPSNVSGLEATWRSISEHTLSQLQRTRNISDH